MADCAIRIRRSYSGTRVREAGHHLSSILHPRRPLVADQANFVGDVVAAHFRIVDPNFLVGR
jgi:hypothetical protein